MLQALKHVKFVVNHSLVALHILLEDDLYSHLARWAVCLSNDAIGACAKRSAESIFGSGRDRSEGAGLAPIEAEIRTSCRNFQVGHAAD